jgi:hypothetical protein
MPKQQRIQFYPEEELIFKNNFASVLLDSPRVSLKNAKVLFKKNEHESKFGKAEFT